MKDKCPVSETMEFLAKKWMLLLLHRVSIDKTVRFCRLQGELTDISPRTLSERLCELERRGLIIRKNYAEIPPRVEYTLSKKGSELVDECFVPISNWAKKWDKKTKA